MLMAMLDELQLELSNDLGELARVNELASPFLERHGISGKSLYVTLLALEETLSNVIRHGYVDVGRHQISVRLRIADGRVELLVDDDGREFDPLSAPKVDLEAPLDQRQAGGLGIHLLRSLASDVRYQRTNGRNHLLVRI